MESTKENSEQHLNKSTKKFLFTKIAILLGTIIVTWFIIDTIFLNINNSQENAAKGECGLIDPTILYSSIDYSLIAHNYPPNSEVPHCSPEWNYIYHIDQYGLRKTTKVSENGAPLAIGDSFTFGFGVEDSQSFSAILNINNGGIWGAPFDVQEKAFERDVELLKPKTVVWSLYAPHVITMMPGEWASKCPGDTSYFADNSQLSNLLRPIVQITILPLIQNSSFGKYMLARLNITKIESDDKGIRIYKNCYETKEVIIYDKNISKNNYTSDEMINKSFGPERDAVYAKIKKLMINAKAVADKNNVDIYFVIIPSRLELKIKDGSYKAPYANADMDSDLPFSTFKNIITGAGFKEDHIINLSEDFMKTGDWQKYYFTKDAHWTKLGHEFVAKILKDRLHL